MRTIVKTLLIFVALASPSIVSAADAFCKLTVNGGIGMNGRCTFDEATGEFSDGLLKTACRSGLSECHPDDLEVIRGGVFGRIVAQNDEEWEFCWNNGGYTTLNECFEGLKRNHSCWLIPHEVVFCIAE